MRLLVDMLRWWIGVLRIDAEVAPRWRCVLAAVLFVPPFGVVLVLLRLRALVKGPLDVETTTVDDWRLGCRLPDLIQMYIHLFGVWEPDLTALLRRQLGEGDVFVDVGANVGYFTLLASGRVGPDGRVVAIDASPANFAALEANLDRNERTETVRAVHCAVSDEVGTLNVYRGPDHNVGLATTVAERGLVAEATVPAAPLADVLDASELDRAGVVKIDVEGGEPAVLAGMSSFLERCPRDVMLLVELSPAWWSDETLTPQDVLSPFIDAGFHLYTMPNNYWPWRYLWPNDVGRPTRYHGSLTERVKRIDLVLSRRDEDVL